MAIKVGGVCGEWWRFSVDCVLVLHVDFAILSRLGDFSIFLVVFREVPFLYVLPSISSDVSLVV